MTQGNTAILITGAQPGTGRTSLSGFSRRAYTATARRMERMSDIEAARHD